MCLAVPMRIKNIQGGFAEVEVGQLTRSVNIELLPGSRVGDYVIVHAGFAIQKINPKKAKDTLKLIHEVR